jgi:hypothetical protein
MTSSQCIHFGSFIIFSGISAGVIYGYFGYFEASQARPGSVRWQGTQTIRL